jgi:Transglycosylase SLT domain
MRGMSALVAVRTRADSRRGDAGEPRQRSARGRLLGAAWVRRLGRWPLRRWRGLGARARFRIKILTAVVMSTAPLWTLNLAVACFGRSVVFPLSPFFLREKASALGAYARHRATCSPEAHADTDHLVKSAEARHRLPRGLLAAVIQVESRGFAHRISAAGAMGPGQLMPATARDLGVSDPFDTAQNVDGAARLLAGHLGRFHNLRLAIAAYHAGPGVVRGHVPNNGQTPGYVARVMHSYAALRPPRALARARPRAGEGAGAGAGARPQLLSERDSVTGNPRRAAVRGRVSAVPP